jgi:hypothetical protein
VKEVRLELLQWAGLFLAPAAWTAQLVLGYGATLAVCSAGGRSFSLTAWEIGVTAAAAAVALGGQAATVLAWRTVRDRSKDDPPPAGRIRFFVDASLLSNAIFLVVILLGGITATSFVPCGAS